MSGQNIRVSSSFDGFQKPQTNMSEGSAVRDDRSEKAQMSAYKPKKADGAFKTISEVADILDVQQHVLRFWETKFTQIKPLKRGGGRRYYRPEDVALLQHIHHLLYTEGYTIKGVQKLLKGQGKQQIIARAENENAAPVMASQPKVKAQSLAPAPSPQVAPNEISATERAVLEVMLEELKALRSLIK